MRCKRMKILTFAVEESMEEWIVTEPSKLQGPRVLIIGTKTFNSHTCAPITRKALLTFPNRIRYEIIAVLQQFSYITGVKQRKTYITIVLQTSF
jgi:hypothetical protein